MCLWSYDNRWMFEQKFSKCGWIASCIFQGIILCTSAIMGFFNTEMDVWVGFRIMVCLGTIASCMALTFESRDKMKKKIWAHLELFVALLGFINILLTWNLTINVEQSEYFRFCGNLQVLLYVFALAPTCLTFIGYFIVKFSYLAMAIVNPSSLVKIR